MKKRPGSRGTAAINQQLIQSPQMPRLINLCQHFLCCQALSLEPPPCLALHCLWPKEGPSPPPWKEEVGQHRFRKDKHGQPHLSPAKQEQWGQALRRSLGSRNSCFLIPENMVSLCFGVKEGSGPSAQGETPNSFLNGVRKNTSTLPSLGAEVIMNMTSYNSGESDNPDTQEPHVMVVYQYSKQRSSLVRKAIYLYAEISRSVV